MNRQQQNPKDNKLLRFNDYRDNLLRPWEALK